MWWFCQWWWWWCYRVLKCDVTKNISLEFPDLITTARKYSRKYELWWKFVENWLNDGWDMTYEFTIFAIHFFINCVRVWTERKISKSVWRCVFIQLLISQWIFARVLSNFHQNLCFWKFFLNIVIKNCKK